MWKPLRIETPEISVENTCILKLNSLIRVFLAELCVNEADGMTNSEDPDQTAPQGFLFWFPVFPGTGNQETGNREPGTGN